MTSMLLTKSSEALGTVMPSICNSNVAVNAKCIASAMTSWMSVLDKTSLYVSAITNEFDSLRRRLCHGNAPPTSKTSNTANDFFSLDPASAYLCKHRVCE